jgi:ribosomal protein S18 acetylase RimI-like enzyme
MSTRDAESTTFSWRGDLTDDELYELTESHGGNPLRGWWDRIRPRSLGWVTARSADGDLVGFVNVAWDGGDHAFLLDTKVRPNRQRRGIGTELVRIAAEQAKAAGCEWMEVDFDDDLAQFYLGACGFTPTAAGLLHLPDWSGR